MGNRSYSQQVHHHPNTVHTTRTTSSKTFFLPTFCRLAINDVVKPPKFTDLSSSQDPSSPKISCIGQIKKRSNTTIISTTTTNKSVNYKKLRKLFSSKNLISPPIDNVTIISNRNRTCTTKSISSKKKQVICIEELDPPLPVVKFKPRDHIVNVNLGTRRGVELKTLQITPFKLSRVHSANSINPIPDGLDSL